MTDPSPVRRPLYPPVWLLLAVFLMLGLHRWAPVRQIISFPYRLLGLIPLAAGLGMILWAAWLFRRAGTTIKPFQTSSSLVTHGPYRRSRNPIYLAMVCALAGIGLMAGSLTPFLIVPAFALLIDRQFIRKEEADLERTFGPGYLAYKASVRRWL